MGTAVRSGVDRVALVVDDNTAVCTMVARILADAGFRAIEAHDGDEALTALSTLKGVVELVVSDVAMPGITGDALARTMAQRWPGLPVLLISGQGGPRGGYAYPFLSKPFTPESLLAAVATVISLPN